MIGLGPSASSRHAWADPDPETVAPGVVRVALPLPLDALRAVNVYVLVSDDDLTLVDGGWALAVSRDALRTGLRSLGADLGDIRRFLVTHLHRDHYTQAVALRRETGASVALGEGERDSLDRVHAADDPRTPLLPQLAGLRACGADDLADGLARALDAAETDDSLAADFAPPDTWLADGETVRVAGRTLVAVETPGHTRGHVVYTDDTTPTADGTGLLFAGDHVLPHITPSIGFEPAPRPGALARFLDSLARVRAMPDRVLLPAHGPAGGSVHTRVDELLAHHRRRLDEIAAVVAGGDDPATAATVAARLTWTRRETPLDDLAPFHRMLAVLETDAHLEVLAAQRRVDRDTADGVAVHRPAG